MSKTAGGAGRRVSAKTGTRKNGPGSVSNVGKFVAGPGGVKKFVRNK